MSYIDDIGSQRANKKFIHASMQEPLLSRQQEFELATRWNKKADIQALHALVRAHTRLVVSHAIRLRNYGLPPSDLIQEGHIGLMNAAIRFDPKREVRFSTYAGWWIRSAMQDYILRNWSIVRLGTKASHKALFFNFRRLCTQMKNQSTSDKLTQKDREAIAAHLQVNVEDVVSMEQRLSACDQSLNAPIGEEDEDYRQDFLVDPSPSVEETTIAKHDAQVRSKWLYEGISILSERERIIIMKRRLETPATTLEELGHQLGVSKERIRQLEKRALIKLRNYLKPRQNDNLSEVGL